MNLSSARSRITRRELADRLRPHEEVRRLFKELSPAELSARYLRGDLPGELAAPVRTFLDRYGHRGVAEIDAGVARWGEDPAHILGALANYMQLPSDAASPVAQFRKGAADADAMIEELARRAGEKSKLRGAAVRFALSRVRALAGVRELPKFHFVEVLARVRGLLFDIADDLVAAGRLDARDDVFMLRWSEVDRAIKGEDVRAIARERRATYAIEMGRRGLPRILLSDGTEPEALAGGNTMNMEGNLRGTPASAGRVTARARVVLDPVGARLEPGEILVAPSTDPGWTPLFLTAAGLVMEMGGAMSHGAVVARECGIPAVVGVPRATDRIKTGDRVTIDGASGTIEVLPEPEVEVESGNVAARAEGGAQAAAQL
jgi:pyruvate,water dikinase